MLYSITRKTYLLIKKDVIVLVPSLIFVFLITFLEQYLKTSVGKEISMNAHLTNYLTMNWFLQMLFMGITIYIANTLYHGKEVVLKLSIKKSSVTFANLLTASAITAIPMGLITYELPQILSGKETFSTWVFPVLLVLFVFKILLLFVPVLIITNQLSWFQSLIHSVRIVRKNIPQVLLYFMYIIAINFIAVFLSLIFLGIPYVGKSLFFVACQGVTLGLISVLTVVFYFELSKKGKVFVKA